MVNIVLCEVILVTLGLISFSIEDFLEYLPFQPAFTCSRLTIETLEQDVKYVQS